MKTILVPLDESDLSLNAMDVVAKMTGPGISIRLLRVVSPIGDREEAQQELDSVAVDWTAKLAPSEVKTLVLEGSAADCIVELAEQENTGLIVMTTHGSGGLGRWLMGSVAERVVRHAPCPVLTIGRKTLEKLQAI
jgi:nucleotide-binding universal stress UspA family protein